VKDRYSRIAAVVLVAGGFLSVGCKSGKDSDDKSSYGRTNTRSFDQWTVGPGHPWNKMSEERREKKEQKQMEKAMAKDEEAFRKAFPRDWNE
jgi:hypothetical protein